MGRRSAHPRVHGGDRPELAAGQRGPRRREAAVSPGDRDAHQRLGTGNVGGAGRCPGTRGAPAGSAPPQRDHARAARALQPDHAPHRGGGSGDQALGAALLPGIPAPSGRLGAVHRHGAQPHAQTPGRGPDPGQARLHPRRHRRSAAGHPPGLPGRHSAGGVPLLRPAARALQRQLGGPPGHPGAAPGRGRSPAPVWDGAPAGGRHGERGAVGGPARAGFGPGRRRDADQVLPAARPEVGSRPRLPAHRLRRPGPSWIRPGSSKGCRSSTSCRSA